MWKIIKVIALGFLCSTFVSGVKAEGLWHTLSESFQDYVFGPRLVSSTDPRVIGAVAAGSLSTYFGGLMLYKIFFNKVDKPGLKAVFKNIGAFAMANMLIHGGVLLVLGSRTMVTGWDEWTKLALRNARKAAYEID